MDREELIRVYNKNKDSIWIGYNIKGYDQYIFKAILLGLNPKEVNDKIIQEGKEGWQISREFNKIPMINYDVYATKTVGLKTLEAFMGTNIKETEVEPTSGRIILIKEDNEGLIYIIGEREYQKENNF